MVWVRRRYRGRCHSLFSFWVLLVWLRARLAALSVCFEGNRGSIDFLLLFIGSFLTWFLQQLGCIRDRRSSWSPKARMTVVDAWLRNCSYMVLFLDRELFFPVDFWWLIKVFYFRSWTGSNGSLWLCISWRIRLFLGWVVRWIKKKLLVLLSCLFCNFKLHGQAFLLVLCAFQFPLQFLHLLHELPLLGFGLPRVGIGLIFSL
jgi:hypothetical protein